MCFVNFGSFAIILWHKIVSLICTHPWTFVARWACVTAVTLLALKQEIMTIQNCNIQPGAVKLVLWRHWLHLSYMHPVMSTNFTAPGYTRPDKHAHVFTWGWMIHGKGELLHFSRLKNGKEEDFLTNPRSGDPVLRNDLHITVICKVEKDTFVLFATPSFTAGWRPIFRQIHIQTTQDPGQIETVICSKSCQPVEIIIIH